MHAGPKNFSTRHSTSLVFRCDSELCKRAYSLCHEYRVYPMDTLYLRVALDSDAVLVSLDREDFINRVRAANPSIRAYHVSEFMSGLGVG